MTSNPFEPPRTMDLDGGGDAVKGRFSLSQDAIAELVIATPWVRWLARLTSVSIAVGLVAAVADFVTSPQPALRILLLFGTAVTTMMWTLFLVVWRRYATASELLRSGANSAAGQVIDAQASVFRLLGVLVAISTGLGVIVFGAGYTLGRLAVMR